MQGLPHGTPKGLRIRGGEARVQGSASESRESQKGDRGNSESARRETVIVLVSEYLFSSLARTKAITIPVCRSRFFIIGLVSGRSVILDLT